MIHGNPFENLIKRQRVLNEKGEIVRNGSRNYEIDNLQGHVEDRDSESSDDDLDEIVQKMETYKYIGSRKNGTCSNVDKIVVQ